MIFSKSAGSLLLCALRSTESNCSYEVSFTTSTARRNGEYSVKSNGHRIHSDRAHDGQIPGTRPFQLPEMRPVDQQWGLASQPSFTAKGLVLLHRLDVSVYDVQSSVCTDSICRGLRSASVRSVGCNMATRLL